MQSRHRSLQNFFVNLITGLLAYTYQPTKPALNFTEKERRFWALAKTELTLLGSASPKT